MCVMAISLALLFIGPVDYSTGTVGTVNDGNYDETTGSLTVNDSGLMPVGQIDNVWVKSISGILQNNGKPFYLEYIGNISLANCK